MFIHLVSAEKALGSSVGARCARGDVAGGRQGARAGWCCLEGYCTVPLGVDWVRLMQAFNYVTISLSPELNTRCGKKCLEFQLWMLALWSWSFGTHGLPSLIARYCSHSPNQCSALLLARDCMRQLAIMETCRKCFIILNKTLYIGNVVTHTATVLTYSS